MTFPTYLLFPMPDGIKYDDIELGRTDSYRVFESEKTKRVYLESIENGNVWWIRDRTKIEEIKILFEKNDEALFCYFDLLLI
jgi:hypothetical protein